MSKKESLIKKAIKQLLEKISKNNYKWISDEDLAEGSQLDEDIVMSFIVDNYNSRLEKLGVDGEEDQPVDDFIELIVQILNTDWYEEIYEKYVDESRQRLPMLSDKEIARRRELYNFGNIKGIHIQ